MILLILIPLLIAVTLLGLLLVFIFAAGVLAFMAKEETPKS